HLPAGADFQRLASEAETSVNKRIEQAGVLTHKVFRVLRQRCAFGGTVHCTVVVQAGAADKGAETIRFKRKFGDDLERAAERAAVIVEVAVVDVGRTAASAVGDALQAAVLL